MVIFCTFALSKFFEKR